MSPMICIELLVGYRTVMGMCFDAGQRYQCTDFNDTHFVLEHGGTGERVCFARSEGRLVEAPKSNVGERV
jgi:hypothetical protein